MTHAQKAGSLMGLLFLFSIVFYFTVERQRPAVTSFTKAPAMAGAAKLPTELVPLKEGIRAITPEALKRLKIPDEIKSDPTRHVTKTATLPRSKGGYDVISVTDDRGDTEILTKEKPTALFSLDNSGRVGIGVGVDTRKGQSAKLFGEYTPATVMGLTAGVEGQLHFHPTDPKAPVSLYGGLTLFKAF